MKSKVALAIISLSGLLLTSCSLYKNPASKASPAPVVQSTGDVETDLKAIDKDMEQDTNTDAAGVTVKDLGL